MGALGTMGNGGAKLDDLLGGHAVIHKGDHSEEKWPVQNMEGKILGLTNEFDLCVRRWRLKGD